MLQMNRDLQHSASTTIARMARNTLVVARWLLLLAVVAIIRTAEQTYHRIHCWTLCVSAVIPNRFNQLDAHILLCYYHLLATTCAAAPTRFQISFMPIVHIQWYLHGSVGGSAIEGYWQGRA